MKDDVDQKSLDWQESLQRLLEPLSVRIETLQPDLNIQQLLADADPIRNLTRTALGPIEELRRNLQIDTVPNIAIELENIRSLGVELENQFRLPTVLETPALLQTLEMDAPAKAIAHYHDHMNDVCVAFEAMNAPWLNIEDQIRSLTGVVELQEIGHVLHTMPVFDIESADRLRPHLGDWRGTIDWLWLP